MPKRTSIAGVFNRAIVDEVVTVTDENAFVRTRELARKEGIVAGVSSGAALHARASGRITQRDGRQNDRCNFAGHRRALYHHFAISAVNA